MQWPVPSDFVHGEALEPPWQRQRGVVVMFFNLECAGCVSRGIPLMKGLYREHHDHLDFLALHTSYGHRQLPREEVESTLKHFASEYARLPFSVALDLSGELATAYQTEGTPHWLLFDAKGQVWRSLFGSQENARTRLEYALEALRGEAG